MEVEVEGRTERERTESLVDCDREWDCADWTGKLRVIGEEPRCEADIRSRTAGILLSFNSFELNYEDITVESKETLKNITQELYNLCVVAF